MITVWRMSLADDIDVPVPASTGNDNYARIEQAIMFLRANHARQPELGELAAGLKPGRTRAEELTVADLTGVGVQDAAVADHVVQAALEQEAGTALEV